MNLSKIYYAANVKMPTDKAHGIQLIKMSEAFLEKNADLELIIPKRSKVPDEEIKQFYNLKILPKINRVFVPNFFDYGRAGFLASCFFFGFSYFIFLLSKKIKGEKFIVYTIDLDHISFLWLFLLGKSYFIEVHGEKKKTFFHKIFFRRASGIVATNHYIKKSLIENFALSSSKIDVRPNGIDLEKFDINISISDARKKLFLPPDKRIILYVGRMYDWKGFGILFSAELRLPKEYVLYFVGGSKEDAYAMTNISPPPNIVFAGVVNQREIPLWLAAADALLLLGTSKYASSLYFTSPMKLFEYMASKRPIVASCTPAIEDIVSKSDVFFYEPDSVDDLQSKIISVFQNQTVAQEKIGSAYKKVAGLTWSKRAEQIMSFMSNNL